MSYGVPILSPTRNGYYACWSTRAVVDVAKKLDISEETVTGVLDRWVTTKVNWDKFQRIEILGIDEIALKRGHRDYVVLITTPSTPQGVEVLAVLTDRKKETVVNFFASIPVRLRNTIERVCTDMYLGFVNAAREQLPRAHIIIDRFHVARAYRNCAELCAPTGTQAAEGAVIRERVCSNQRCDVAVPQIA